VDNTSQLPDLGIGKIDTKDIYSLRICKGKKLTGVLVAKWYFLNAFALDPQQVSNQENHMNEREFFAD